MEEVILVDEKDKQIGYGEKMEVHKKGLLHRAFSLLVFNSKGELMLQLRAKSKYHSGGLWTNTCCSHPRPGEDLDRAVHRRLKEEMGFDTELEEVFSFIYKVHLENKLFEHELDHVFVGYFEGEPKVNPEEADSWKWMNFEKLAANVYEQPEKYTYWFKELMKIGEEKHFKPKVLLAKAV